MEHSTNDVYEMHAVLKGNVQGVGFRAMTRYYAAGMGLTGSVSNLADGSVEIYAYGTKSRLEELMQKLRGEAFSDHIAEEEIEFVLNITPSDSFRILH